MSTPATDAQEIVLSEAQIAYVARLLALARTSPDEEASDDH